MHFDSSKLVFEALTYDDVLLLPGYSEVLPRDTDTSTHLTKNIKLNIPLVSAAMDTVTESDLAIAMALEGGIGFIHKNMTIEQQAAQVRKVKRSQSGMILDPVTLHGDATVGDALAAMKEHKIGGIPVIDKDKTLVGIITNRDLRFQKNKKQLIKEIMTKDNLITAKDGIGLEGAEEILQEYKIEKLPIVNDAGKMTGLITYKDILKNKDKPNACKDEFGRLRVGAAVGVTPDIKERIQKLIDAGVDVVSIDTAHGHSKGVIDTCKTIKSAYPDLDVIVGNIATAEAATALADAGADAIKVGVGPGSICTTQNHCRSWSVPQLSAVYEVSQSSQKVDRCSDHR